MTATFPTKPQAGAWARRVETELLTANVAGIDPAIRKIPLTLPIDRYIREMRPVQKWGTTRTPA